MRSSARARLVSSALVVVLSSGALAPAVAHAQPPASSKAEAEARDRSRAAFRKGVAQLRASDWSGARASFESAYTLFPHPSILLNLASTVSFAASVF